MQVLSAPSIFSPARLFLLAPDPAARVHRIKTDADEVDDPLDFETVLALREARRLRHARYTARKREREAAALARRVDVETKRRNIGEGVCRSWNDEAVVAARMKRYAAAVNNVLYPSLAVALAALAPGFRGIAKARSVLLAAPDRRGEVAGFEVRLVEVDRAGWPIEPADQGKP